MADPTPDYAADMPRRRFELVARCRRFVTPAAAFFLAWYLGFVALAGYAPALMSSSIYEGFTVGYALALSQFVVVCVLGWMYLRRSDDEFDGLAARRQDGTSPVA